jgi:hypothetical protein
MSIQGRSHTLPRPMPGRLSSLVGGRDCPDSVTRRVGATESRSTTSSACGTPTASVTRAVITVASCVMSNLALVSGGALEAASGVTDGSTYWCVADPGWAYSLHAVIAAPLSAGLSTVLVSGGSSVEGTWRVLAGQEATDFTAAPTVYRGLRSSAVAVPAGSALQRRSSAGELLPPRSTRGRPAPWGCRCTTTSGRPRSAWCSPTATTPTWPAVGDWSAGGSTL